MKTALILLILCILCNAQGTQADESLMSVITDLRILSGEDIKPLHDPPVSLGALVNSMKRLSGLGGWIVETKYIGEGYVMPRSITADTGQSFTLTLTPQKGWKVGAVYLDGIPTDPNESLTLTVTGDHNIEVNFTKILPEQFTAAELNSVHSQFWSVYELSHSFEYDSVLFAENTVTFEPQSDPLSGLTIQSSFEILPDSGYLKFFIPGYGDQFIGIYERREKLWMICWKRTFDQLFAAMETGACEEYEELERWFFTESDAQDFINAQRNAQRKGTN